MKLVRGLLGRLVPFALGGHDMHQHRAIQLVDVVEHLHQLRQVVAVQRAEIFESQRLEQGARRQKSLQRIFGPPGKMQDIRADGRDISQ